VDLLTAGLDIARAAAQSRVIGRTGAGLQLKLLLADTGLLCALLNIRSEEAVPYGDAGEQCPGLICPSRPPQRAIVSS